MTERCLCEGLIATESEAIWLRGEVVRLTAERDGLVQERAAIEYAAHMPADYEFGLPSWINQRLYGALLSMTDSDGGPIRRTEDVEQMHRLRTERDRLLVLLAWSGGVLTIKDTVEYFGLVNGFGALERFCDDMAERGRALVVGGGGANYDSPT